MKSKFLFWVLAVAAVFFFSGSAAAKPQWATAAGTAFTYQGRLIDGGSPANGAYDFTFTLFDADVGGTQVAGVIAPEDVPVTDGLFTVQLEFGAVYDGSVRFLEIGVRPGASTGAFTILGPRQRLDPTPYALDAFAAPWSGLTGIPAGFADGIDNVGTYTNGNGLQLIGNEFSVLFGGSGTANTAARSDHDHWGASWAGTETGLTLAGGNIGLYGDGVIYGLYGSSGSSVGVKGASTDGTGVSGTGFTGIEGVSNAVGGTGVYGSTYTGSGDYAGYFDGNVKVNGSQTVTGSGTNLTLGGGSTALSASGTNYAGYFNGNVQVNGAQTVASVSNQTSLMLSGGGTGVNAAGDYYGVRGRANLGGYGVYGTSASGIGVVGESTGTGYAGYFIGNVAITGNFTASGTKSAVVDTQTFGERALYAVESPENWFEDFGSGQLVDGKAVISIDPVFAQTVNLNQDYHVFLTPLGDCALYVETKSPTSFSVRPVGRQPCSAAFEYRIVAKRLGYEDLRLAVSDQAAAAPAAPDER